MRGRGENWGEGKRRALIGIIRSVRCRIWWWGSQGCWAVWVGRVECYVTALGDLQAHLPGWEMRSTQWLSHRLCSLSRGIWIPGQWCLFWSHLFSFSSDHCWCHCSTGVFSPWWVHLPWWIPQYCQSGPHQSWACISYPSSGVRQPLGCARLSWGIRDHSQVKSWRRRFACNYQQAILKSFWLKIKWVALAKSVRPSHWDSLPFLWPTLTAPWLIYFCFKRIMECNFWYFLYLWEASISLVPSLSSTLFSDLWHNPAVILQRTACFLFLLSLKDIFWPKH